MVLPNEKRARANLASRTIEEIQWEMDRLAEGLTLSISSNHPVVVEIMDGPSTDACLLPFYLELVKPDAVRELPINKNFGLVPYGASQRSSIESLALKVEFVYEQRRAARFLRYKEARDKGEDFVLCDWESRYHQHKKRISRLQLPVNAFIAVDEVDSKGVIRRGRRPVLGRIAERNGRRISLLVPCRPDLDGQAVAKLAQVGNLIIDLQEARGASTLQLISSILRERRNGSTVIIVDGPSAYLDLDVAGMLSAHRIMPLIHALPKKPRLRILMVGQHRLQSESIFRASISGLESLSAIAFQLVRQAERTWWNLHQTLLQTGTAEASFKQWCSILDRYQKPEHPETAFFTEADNLIRQTATCAALPGNRMQAVLKAANDSGGESILLVAKTRAEASAVLERLSLQLGMSTQDLAELGYKGVSCRDRLDESADSVVCAGYYGPRTLRLLRNLTPSLVHMVMDPVEVRWALAECGRVLGHIRMFAPIEEIQFYETLYHELQAVAMPILPMIDRIIDLSAPAMDTAPSLSSSQFYRVEKPGEHATLRVHFVNGTIAELAESARLERLSRGRSGYVEAIKASQLVPGDEVIVVDEDLQQSFSERLMKALDSSLLRHEAGHRKTWAGLVYALGPHTASDVRARLRKKGIDVDYSTVRTWIPRTPTEVTAVPSSWEHFRALAETVGVALPNETLAPIYASIKRWRSVHRRMGRILVRIIRGAYLGRLNPSVVRQVQEYWGLDVRELVLGAQVLTVDRIEQMEV